MILVVRTSKVEFRPTMTELTKMVSLVARMVMDIIKIVPRLIITLEVFGGTVAELSTVVCIVYQVVQRFGETFEQTQQV